MQMQCKSQLMLRKRCVICLRNCIVQKCQKRTYIGEENNRYCCVEFTNLDGFGKMG